MAQQWSLNTITLGSKNLIVGRNSTGKTRALNIIGGLARILSASFPTPATGNYHAEWVSSDGKRYVYCSKVQDAIVEHESLKIDGVVFLERGQGGYGKIVAEKINNGQIIDFQTPPNEFSILKRRDAMQHSFIEPIYEWASAVRHYHFGSTLGKDILSIVVPNGPAVDERDENQVVGIFRKGLKEFSDVFSNGIIQDMKAVGYDISYIGTAIPFGVRIHGGPGELASLVVQETELPCQTDQLTMSQGMYRVLALLVHVNYLQMKGTSTCVIIDDIGEGLDYERSCRLINLLRKKSDDTNLQIIMSTNDRFVMNEVPLEEWTVLQRSGTEVTARNYSNSRSQFDEFRFTGLSNFSFFEMDYLNSQEEDV